MSVQRQARRCAAVCHVFNFTSQWDLVEQSDNKGNTRYQWLWISTDTWIFTVHAHAHCAVGCLTVGTDSLYCISSKSVPGSLLGFVLSHLRVWLTITSFDWNQNSPVLDFAFRNHPHIKTKVMSVMKKKKGRRLSVFLSSVTTCGTLASVSL